MERVIHKKLTTDVNVEQEIETFIHSNPHIKVLLKKGEHGSTIFYLKEDAKVHQTSKPAYSFADFPSLKLVDTTGAGDCFTGAFAVQMLEGKPYDEALEFANKVGFLCITKFGAGPSIPTFEEIESTFKK